MLKDLDGFLRRASHTSPVHNEAETAFSLWDLAQSPLSEAGRDVIGPAWEAAGCLGRRTAELHLVLSEAQDLPDFTPEALTLEYRQARHQSMVQMWKQVVQLLTQRSIQGPLMEQAMHLLAQEARVLAIFETFLDLRHGGQRIRCHGDYHLGQVLWTGADYVLTDFEGEPARPLRERRLKHSPLYDVAGMLRSLDYASWTALGKFGPEDARQTLEPWAIYWSRWVRARFLGQYLTHVHGASFWPPSRKDAVQLLTIHELEKAVYELGYELNNRPEWVGIPLKGIHEIVWRTGARTAA
jgi:maltose alpha-D-glucosyltransferase/alpha-amylase